MSEKKKSILFIGIPREPEYGQTAAYFRGHLPVFTMQKHYETCLVAGCGKATQGKQYCAQHALPSQRRSLSVDLRALIRSECCDATCVTGDAHEYGEQYCTKCKQPCCWKT